MPISGVGLKVVTTAGIEAGVLDPNERIKVGAYEFGKRIFHCHKRSEHGRINLAHAGCLGGCLLQTERNSALISLPTTLADLGSAQSRLGINGESAGTVRPALITKRTEVDSSTVSVYLQPWVGVISHNPSSGGSRLCHATNGGRVLKPRIIDRIQDHQGKFSSGLLVRMFKTLASAHDD